jgi:hypothetical protein
MRLATAASGVTASVVRHRGSRLTRWSSAAQEWRPKRIAGAVPISRASRVFALPATGALAMMIRRQQKGAAPERGAFDCRNQGRRLTIARTP